MKRKVLVSAPYIQRELDDYLDIFQKRNIELVVPKVEERLSEEQLMNLIENIDGVIAGDDQFTAKVLKSAPKLKVLSKWGTGIDSFDQVAARELGIEIRNTPGAFNEPVADQVLGYMLSFARRIPWIDSHMKLGGWEKLPCFSLRGRTLGVIGVGNVGKTIVRRAKTFGMRILGNDILKMPDDYIAETGIEMVDKEYLLENSDFVSLNSDLNETSYHIVGKNEFSSMKETAYIMNTARGPLIDEPAMIEALQVEEIAGAGLDVFEGEPLPNSSPLRSMPNVLLSPHNANSSPEHWRRIHESTIENLLEVLMREESPIEVTAQLCQ